MNLLIVLLVICILIQLIYWFFVFSKLAFYDIERDRKDYDQVTHGVSIVVVFKNELENLKKLIPNLLGQKYPTFEVILCDDYSSDGSSVYISDLDDRRLKVIHPTEDTPGKKLAITEAVAQANFNYILTTDADCRPNSPYWISTMVQQTQKSDIILGYSPYVRLSGWLNNFIRYETFTTAIQYLSYALSGIPYMGVGRNLLYTKTLFQNSNALQDSKHILSGDDDLLINDIATELNTSICIHKEAIVYSEPKKTWSAFIKQKMRHLSSSAVYKTKHKFLLGLYAATHILIYLLLFTLLLFGQFMVCLIAYLVFILLRWFIAARVMDKLSCSDLIPLFPILDVVMSIYLMLMSPYASFIKSKSWS